MSSESSPSFFYPFRLENTAANLAYINGIASENDILGLHGRSSVVGLDTVVGLEPEWSVELLTLEPGDHLGVAMLNVGFLMICEAKTCYLTD